MAGLSLWCVEGNVFSLSNSDTRELEEAVLSLSESKVSLSDTEFSRLLVLALLYTHSVQLPIIPETMPV